MDKEKTSPEKTKFEQMLGIYQRILQDRNLTDTAPICGKVWENYYGTDSMHYFWYRLGDSSSRVFLLASYPVIHEPTERFKSAKGMLNVDYEEGNAVQAIKSGIWRQAQDIKEKGHEKCTSEIEEGLMQKYLDQQYKEGKIIYESFSKGNGGEHTESSFREKAKMLAFANEVDSIAYCDRKANFPVNFEGVLDTENVQHYALVLDSVAVLVINKRFGTPVITRYTYTWGSSLARRGVHGRVFIEGIRTPQELQTAQILLKYIEQGMG
jgi:hypothetical protein